MLKRGLDHDSSDLRNGIGVLTKEAKLQQEASPTVWNFPLWVPDVGDFPASRTERRAFLLFIKTPTHATLLL